MYNSGELEWQVHDFYAAASPPYNAQPFQIEKRFDLALPALAIETESWITGRIVYWPYK